MTPRNEQGPDLLERALAALRDAPCPSGPPAPLAAATVEALQAAAQIPEIIPLRERRQKMFRLARYGGLGAAAMLLVALAAWLILLDRSAPLAFADVVRNVKNAKTVTFVTKMPSIIRGSKRSFLQQRWYIQAERFRMEVPREQEGVTPTADMPPVLMALVADAAKKDALQIDFYRKTAKHIKGDEKIWDEMTKGLANPIEQLRQLTGKDAERLGEEELDGKKVQVYRLKRTDLLLGMRLTGKDTAKLWVDPKTGLPVRIAVEPSADSKEKAPQFIFEQFRWNEALDPNLFNLEVPKGFQVEQ
jgi:hypothetical protein